MHITRSEEHVQRVFSPHIPSLAEIESGMSVTLETRDASDNQIRPGRNAPIDRSRTLPVTGPVAVKGARPGDALAITLNEIRFAEYGHAWVRPGGGVRAMSFEEPYHVRAFRVGTTVELVPGKALPLRPMMGIIGVAPQEPIPTRLPGVHGGNMDCVDVTAGNTLWLPVLVPGGNFSAGDAHAAMGEGEVSGTGIEIEATLTVTVTLHPQRTLDGPVVVTPEKTVFLASAETLEQAGALALERAVQAIMTRGELPEVDAYIAASIGGNLRICQVVNGLVTVGHELPQALLRW